MFLRCNLSITIMKPAFIVSTYPDKKSISEIATRLIQDRIIACVNISEISSIYTWEGKIQNASEYIAIFKTVSKNKALLEGRIKETHPYDVPEIAEISINSINDAYMNWLASSTTITSS